MWVIFVLYYIGVFVKTTESVKFLELKKRLKDGLDSEIISLEALEEFLDKYPPPKKFDNSIMGPMAGEWGPINGSITFPAFGSGGRGAGR